MAWSYLGVPSAVLSEISPTTNYVNLRHVAIEDCDLTSLIYFSPQPISRLEQQRIHRLLKRHDGFLILVTPNTRSRVCLDATWRTVRVQNFRKRHVRVEWLLSDSHSFNGFNSLNHY